MNGVILSYGHCLDLTPFEKTPMGVVKIPEVSLGEAALMKMVKAGITDITVIADCGAHLWAQAISNLDENLSVGIMTPTIGRGPVGALNEIRLSNGFDTDGCFVHPDNIVSAVNVAAIRKAWETSDTHMCLAIVVQGVKEKGQNGYTVKPPQGYSFTEMCVVSGDAVEMAVAVTNKEQVKLMDLYQACYDKGVLEFMTFDNSFFAVENQTNLRMLLK